MEKSAPNLTKKISRRDALKLLTAATGAVVLANVPARWDKPELKFGVLPAHAQTSAAHVLAVLPAGLKDNSCEDGQQTVDLTAVISPRAKGIVLQYVLSYHATGPSGSITSPGSLTGTLTTDASGQVSLTVVVTADKPVLGTEGVLTVVWSFVHPADGKNTVTQDVKIEIAC